LATTTTSWRRNRWTAFLAPVLVGLIGVAWLATGNDFGGGLFLAGVVGVLVMLHTDRRWTKQ